MTEKAVGGHDVCHTCAAHCVALEDAEERIGKLEAALAQISEDESIDAAEMRLIAHNALAESDAAVKP